MKIMKVLLLVVFFIPMLVIGQKESDVKAINELVDAWHQAATDANADAYFDKMTENAVFIGTDAGERWTKKEFMEFALPYFNKGKAWDFTVIERQVYFASDKNTAWFDETLNTWMGVCRSSGVLVRIRNTWYIAHYQLSVTVPNDKIEDFIDLMKAEEGEHLE